MRPPLTQTTRLLWHWAWTSKELTAVKTLHSFGTGSSHRSMMCKVKRVHSWRATLRVTPLLWHWLKTQLFKMRRETRSRYAVLRERSNKSFRWLKLIGRSLLWTWKVDTWLLSHKTIWLRFLTLAEDSINRLFFTRKLVTWFSHWLTLKT